MKKLLIMGANPETISLICKAKDMGIKTYVTDYNKKTYAKKFADVPLNIDAMNIDAIVDYVRKENIDGVLVGVAEALMTSYCKVCAELEYPCFASLEQFEIMTAKNKFKDTCRKYGVPVVDEYSVDNPDEIRYPVVVKPVDSSSSKGISICQNRAELDTAVEKALSFSPSKTILIEKYMGGLEVIMYYVIQNGEPSFVAMCDRYTSKEQEGITQLPSAYIFPSKHIERFKSEADEKVCNMLRGLNIENGVLFLQSFIDDDGSVRVYEPGFRLNGAQEHMIVSQITGIDAKELLINYALNGKMSDKKVSEMADPYFKGKWACKLSPLVKEGKIGRIEGVDAIRNMYGVISVNPNYEDGETVKGLGTQRQMAANIFIYADNRDELAERVDQVIKNFRVFDENDGNMLLKPFDIDIIMQEY
ncbi:MAG: ATP-grasp domain-containing protein [Ruminococcus sp.]|nr:ATP-grasp domain-containing protein [Ruminococcus sp.]